MEGVLSVILSVTQGFMKVLVIGGGGREHALAWRLKRAPSVTEVIASPGNPGIAQLGTCIPAPEDVSGYADLAKARGVNLTGVGPEVPLVAGVVDRFRQQGLKIVGPTAAAARLEGSKIFAKRFLERTCIPTARSVQTATEQEALSALKGFDLPVVIKADGLAAGKGVVIAEDENTARAAVQQLGPTLVIEEFLQGEEVSFIGLSDGKTVLPLAPTQDHKRAFDGDTGPNTGGMGAYCDSRILTPGQTGLIMDRVMQPAVAQMAADRIPFTGFLYAGLMMTADGPKVLEFNVRLGDPETQALMYSFEGDLAELFLQSVTGGVSPLPAASWKTPSACVVLSSFRYPETPRTGDSVTGIEAAEATGATVFHAGTKQAGGKLVTGGGRVLGVTAGGSTLKAALENAYRATSRIHFDGMHYRKDIGHKGLRRW